MGSSRITNVLLVVVTVLLLLNLAVPSFEQQVPPLVPAADPAPLRLRADLERLIGDLEVAVRLSAPAASGPREEHPDDALVVRIPGRLADEWGLTAEDVRAVIGALARAGKSMGGARSSANETAAIATLRNCCSAQAQFQATSKADVDRDGTGEFGAFVELSGAKEVRGDARTGRMNPPVLSGAFRNPSPRGGMVSRSGYYFRIYLPDRSGEGVAADSVGFANVDPNLAETTWCCYAWPINESAGARTFFMNQTGDVLATEAPEYAGSKGPLPGAAFLGGGRLSITGHAAVGQEGQDGNGWVQVN